MGPPGRRRPVVRVPSPTEPKTGGKSHQCPAGPYGGRRGGGRLWGSSPRRHGYTHPSSLTGHIPPSLSPRRPGRVREDSDPIPGNKPSPQDRRPPPHLPPAGAPGAVRRRDAPGLPNRPGSGPEWTQTAQRPGAGPTPCRSVPRRPSPPTTLGPAGSPRPGTARPDVPSPATRPVQPPSDSALGGGGGRGAPQEAPAPRPAPAPFDPCPQAAPRPEPALRPSPRPQPAPRPRVPPRPTRPTPRTDLASAPGPTVEVPTYASERSFPASAYVPAPPRGEEARVGGSPAPPPTPLPSPPPRTGATLASRWPGPGALAVGVRFAEDHPCVGARTPPA